MMEDLSLTSNEYSVALVVFFVSYVVFEVPSNLVLSRTRPSRFLPIIMFLWGGITCCMAVIHNYHQLVALRFVVGIFEAGFAPGILLILSSWYKKNEQSKRFGIYISAAVLSGAFGGILAGAITEGLDGAYGIAGWRWLFVRVPHLHGRSRADRLSRSLKARQRVGGLSSPRASSSTSRTRPRNSPQGNGISQCTVWRPTT